MLNISCICNWRALDGKGTIRDEFCRPPLPMSYCGEAGNLPELDELWREDIKGRKTENENQMRKRRTKSTDKR